MPYINLIQEQRLAAQASERKARSFFFIFVGALTVSVLSYGFLSVESMLVGGQAAAIDTQNKKNLPLVKQIEKNTKDLAELTPRLNTLQDAQTVTDRWNRILSHLVVQTPSTAWLTAIHCMSTDPTKPTQITFSGVSTAQAPIGEFIMRLQNLPDLDNVNLKYTNEKLISTTRATEFQLDCDIVGTAEQKVKTEADDKK